MASNNRLVLPAVIAGLALAGVARSQFVGDLFFAEPSIAVDRGDVGTLTVRFFIGTTVHGAVAFDLVYDQTLLQVEAVEIPADSGYDGLAVVKRSGRFGVALFNADDLSEPFGTVDTLEITVRAIGPIGTTTSLVIDALAAVDATRAPIEPVRGLGASVLITTPTSQQPLVVDDGGVRDSEVSTQHPFTGEPVPYRRIGSTVLLAEEQELADDRVVFRRIQSAIPTSTPEEGGRRSDTNFDGRADIFDLFEFFAAFTRRQPWADLNADGTVDVFDLIEFQHDFGR